MARSLGTLVLALLLGISSTTSAQSVDAPAAPPLSRPRLAEALKWSKAFTDWKAWYAQWRNRPEPGLIRGTRSRRARPTPPQWLPDACRDVLGDPDPLASSCTLLREWREDDLTTELRLERTAATTTREQEGKTTWWEHLHMDMLWPSMQAQNAMYGIAGMHMSLTVKGRFEMFGAPGAMFVNVPTQNGGRAWVVATNYGLGYRLFDFTLPGGRAANAHVNFAKAYLMSDVPGYMGKKTVDFVGFSISLKKMR